MQKEKNCMSLFIVLCVAFVLLAFSYVSIPPWLMLSTRQAVHEPRGGSHSCYYSGFEMISVAHNYLQSPTIQPTIDGGQSKCSITAPDNTNVSLCQIREVIANYKNGDNHTFADEDMYGTNGIL